MSLPNMPVFGIGTFQMKGSTCYDAIVTALRKGYRLIDTGRCYNNEIDISKAIETTGINRQDIFIINKIAPNEHGYTEAYDAVKTSLIKLNTSYIDLMLIHWPGKSMVPVTSTDNRQWRHDSWKGLIKAKEDGLVKDIGVSNFTVAHLTVDPIFQEYKPSLNQIEVHPMNTQTRLREYCKANDITIQAYSSLGQLDDRLYNHSTLSNISIEAGLSKVEILFAWALQQDICIIPKSKTKCYIDSNYDVIQRIMDKDVFLSNHYLAVLNSMDCNLHICWNPELII